MTVELAGCTDVGVERDHQEDAFDAPSGPLQAEDYDRGVLLIVADGVGGLRAGDEASRLAVKTTRDVFVEEWSPDVRYILERAVSTANTAVFVRGQEPAFSGMGTTIVCCVLRDGQLYVAHVGDSRLYRLRNGLLELLTVDHSWVREQVALGVLTEEEARTHGRRHILTRSLGSRPTVEVDMRQFALLDGDRLLLCSDGLYDLVEERAIAEVMTLPPRDACRRLIDLANTAGGSDNITVVLAVVALTGPSALTQPPADEATRPHLTVDRDKTAERPAAGGKNE
jgi:protein phosphatase